MSYIKKIYLSLKRTKTKKTKIIIISIIIIIIVFILWNETRDINNCIIPINITRDSIMRLLPKPEFLVPPPFINFSNQ